MGPQFLFMDDNAPPHRTVTVEELLESEDIEHMDWSAREDTRSSSILPLSPSSDFRRQRLSPVVSDDSILPVRQELGYLKAGAHLNFCYSTLQLQMTKEERRFQPPQFFIKYLGPVKDRRSKP
ncbi:hypothetical protein X975_24402, partial [Stegodyphus mimosarum]